MVKVSRISNRGARIAVLSLIMIAGAFCVLRAQNASSPEIKVVASVQKTGYVGESMPYIIYLESTSPNIADVRLVKNPEMPSEFTRLRGAANSSRPDVLKEKGKTLYRWIISREFLKSDKVGKYTIPGGKYVVFIPHERIVNHGFWGHQRVVDYEEIEVSANSVSVKIDNLPALKGENDFSECVGEFVIESWFPPGKIYEGNEAYAIFTISGYGSLENLKIPNMSKLFSEGCYLKEVEQNDSQTQRDGKLFSEITLTCKFVAVKDEFEISPLCMKFFSPEKKTYYDICSEALHWTNEPTKKEDSSLYKGAIGI